MNADLKNLVQLNREHVKPAAEVLARAFNSYPVLPYFFPDELKRHKVSTYFFQISLYYCYKYGENYATSVNMEGIAAWFHSDYFPMTAGRLIRSVPLPAIIGSGMNSGIMRQLGEHVDKTHKRLASFEHWFLETIGVAPEFQGKGYAGKLMWPMLARIDSEGLPCYLDTIDERRVSLYQHFGFEVLEESKIPGTELTLWAMLREAR